MAVIVSSVIKTVVIEYYNYMREHDISLEKINTARGYISDFGQNRVLRECIGATVDNSPSAARYNRLLRGLGGAVLSLSRSDIALYSIRHQGKLLGLGSILPGVSIVHGSAGQLNKGIELDYVCHDGMSVGLQQSVVTALRDMGDALCAATDSKKYGMAHQLVREHDITRGGNTRIVRKRFVSYISGAPHERTKIESLDTHPLFVRIEGISPLELSGGADPYSVAKSHIGLFLYETRKHSQISAE